MTGGVFGCSSGDRLPDTGGVDGGEMCPTTSCVGEPVSYWGASSLLRCRGGIVIRGVCPRDWRLVTKLAMLDICKSLEIERIYSNINLSVKSTTTGNGCWIALMWLINSCMTLSLFNKVSVFYGLPEKKRGTGSVSQLTHIVTVLSN